MKKHYVIYSLISQGYWSRITNNFGGYLFCKKYETRGCNEIHEDLEKCSLIEPCTILEVYDTEK